MRWSNTILNTFEIPPEELYFSDRSRHSHEYLDEPIFLKSMYPFSTSIAISRT